MRQRARSLSILIIIMILILPLTVTPAFAEGDPPPTPTPTDESTPPDGSPPTSTDATPPAEEDGEESPPAEPPSEEEAASPDQSEAPAALEAPEDEADPIASDPYFTYGATTYRYSSGLTYCDDNFLGDPNCYQNLGNPLQTAITDLSGLGSPDDGTVYVEDGVYNNSVTIDGAFWTSAPLPVSLTVQSLNGSSVTSFQSFNIQNMQDFTLQGFSVTAGISAGGNVGTLTLTDITGGNTPATGIAVDNQTGAVVATGNTGTLTISNSSASSTTGDGITVSNHDGDVVLNTVQANANAGAGAMIDNTAGSGDVTVTDSQFNDNNTVAAGGQQGGLEVDSNGTVTLNNVQANGNLDGDGASVRADTIMVDGGNFNQNTSPGAGFGNGLAAQSTGGEINVSGITASHNEESGALLWYPASAADAANLITVENSSLKSNGEFGVWAQPESGRVVLRCDCMTGNALGDYMVPVGETVERYPCPDKEEDHGPKYKFVGVVLSEEEPKIVNATNGVLVTFPPIQIIDPDELPIGKVWPRKKFELPAEIPEGDTFMAGVEVEMINAEFVEGLEDGELKIEFFIPGYLAEREFSVLWWDVEAEEWVEVPFEFEPHVRLPGGKIVATWPETGTFILVLHPGSTG